ncbi:MAG TPA: hypothetical protein VMI54_04205 [Polyangiaceae bacterium]|nr:hypothetical protein [Polyangiaceae bacterium]
MTTIPTPTITPNPVGSSFREGVQKLSPPWLANENGYKFTYSAIGVPLDAQAEYLRLGKLQGFPGYAQPAALPFLGRDRRMLRGFREADAGFASRVIGAFQTWRLAGGAPNLLAQLADYFSPTPPVLRYVVNGIDNTGHNFTDWWTLNGGTLSQYRQQDSSSWGTNWNWDNQVGQIRFWIIVYRNQGFTPWFWGDGHTWGEQHLSWGFTEDFTQNFAYDVRNFIRQWKAAGSHCGTYPGVPAGIIVTGDMTLFQPNGSGAGYPDGTWGRYSSRAGIHDAVNPTFYLDGV